MNPHSSPSRRAMLGALAAVPIASVPTLARAPAIEPDPIFALIEAAKLARIKLEEGHAILERLLNQFSSDVPRPIGKVTILGHQFESNRRDKLVALLNEAKLVERDPAAHEVECATILSKFDEEKRAYDAKRQKSGLDEVERREFELSDARWDAEDAVLNAQPHSPAGLFDLIMFMAEYIAEDTMTDICKIVPVFVNAAKAMRAIAGDARPVTISKDLQEVLHGSVERRL